MYSKVLSVLAIFVFISSAQAGFRDDLTQFLTPWINAGAAARPLLNLIFDELYFAQTNLVGMEPRVLSSIYHNTEKKLISMEKKSANDKSKACVQNFLNVLQTATEKFKTDGNCLKIQLVKAERILVPLFLTIFPVAPTPACPIPVLCKLDVLNFSAKKLRESLGVLRELHTHVIGLLKYIVYFKPEITSCRKDSNDYKTLTSTLLETAPVCGKL